MKKKERRKERRKKYKMKERKGEIERKTKYNNKERKRKSRAHIDSEIVILIDQKCNWFLAIIF